MAGEKVLPFPISEYEARLSKVRAGMQRRGLDVALVSTPENVYYLSGFQSTVDYQAQIMVVPLDSPPFLVTRLLDRDVVATISWVEGLSYKDYENVVQKTCQALEERGLARARLGVEMDSWFLTAASLRRMEKLMPSASFADCSGLVEEFRLIKSPAEIEYLRAAARTLESCVRSAIEAIHEGATENEVAVAAYSGAILAGSEYFASPMYVSSGPRAALAHATWAGRRIERGDLVSMELFGNVKRYSTGIMRAAVVGPPSPTAKKMETVALDAVESALAAVKPGATLDDVTQAAKRCYFKAGWGDYFLKGPGYATGLAFPPGSGEGHIMAIHEGGTAVLVPGMAFHIIPSLKVPGVGNIGLSEPIVVTETGYELLANIPRELVVR